MKTYRIYGLATISKYLGLVEANSKEEAIDKAQDDLSEEMSMCVCHQCVKTLGGDSPEISDFEVEEEE